MDHQHKLPDASHFIVGLIISNLPWLSSEWPVLSVDSGLLFSDDLGMCSSKLFMNLPWNSSWIRCTLPNIKCSCWLKLLDQGSSFQSLWGVACICMHFEFKALFARTLTCAMMHMYILRNQLTSNNHSYKPKMTDHQFRYSQYSVSYPFCTSDHFNVSGMHQMQVSNWCYFWEEEQHKTTDSHLCMKANQLVLTSSNLIIDFSSFLHGHNKIFHYSQESFMVSYLILCLGDHIYEFLSYSQDAIWMEN